ncbi:hypothetical protein [Mucilaginibacter auburnensis]|uniref:Uncharacterized protein n=1 Tax=Mucilaginibacter auburnensis TaxID=1457233 RepID=A0A2H9VRS8_9SPHI|nr:hypothetical protein [Mucilaginibacter auburnensis]PJJ83523.1 hypothetical protein CLV57_0507 [Mucilaginibacter auburnensis]
MSENWPVAVWTLARYKRKSDIGIIKKAFNNPDTEDYAIRAAIITPDSSFYISLTKIFEREWAKQLYNFQKWQLIYKALAKYPHHSETLALFNRTVSTTDEFRYKALGADLLIAITKYHHPIYDPIKKQIKLDEYEMREVKDAVNGND